MNRTALNMKKLIDRKYYATKEAVMEKLDLFLMAGSVTDNEYTDLILLAQDTYISPVTPPTAQGTLPETLA